jgi:collagenase-like PrtC family protease
MKLSVPLNWDNRLIDGLKDGNYPVCDLYGSLPETPVGSGRPSVLIPGTNSQRMAARVVKQIHANGYKFTYLLNSPCLDNLEYTKAFQKKINDHLNWLVDIGTDCVTVTVPYLIELIKQRFPALKVRVSLIADVNSLARAKFYESLGADEMTVSFMSNRDFSVLKDIAEQSKLLVSLVVNEACLFQCPLRSYHFNLMGHASQNQHFSKGYYMDYCLMRCTLARLGSPKEIIMSPWIRPEDIKIYEKETGIEHFKISGRGYTTEWIMDTVRAYSSGSYTGNLLDLLDAHESSRVSKRDLSFLKRLNRLVRFVLSLPIKFYKDAYQLRMGLRQLPEQVYTLDNSRLDGFLDHFVKGNCKGNCHACDYCKSWADRTITYNPPKRKLYVDSYSSILRGLAGGEYFK